MTEEQSAGPDVPVEPVPCEQCMSPIHPAARVCPACGNAQGKRRLLAISNSALGLLVALITVLASLVGALSAALHDTTSKATVSWAAFNQGKVSVVASNVGDSTAVITEIRLKSDLPIFSVVDISTLSSRIIEKGSGEIRFSFDALPRTKADLVGKHQWEDRAATLAFTILQSNGKPTVSEIPVSYRDLYETFSASEAKCAVDETQAGGEPVSRGSDRRTFNGLDMKQLMQVDIEGFQSRRKPDLDLCQMKALFEQNTGSQAKWLEAKNVDVRAEEGKRRAAGRDPGDGTAPGRKAIE